MAIKEPLKQKTLRDRWARELQKINQSGNDLLQQQGPTSTSIKSVIEQILQNGKIVAQELINTETQYANALPEPDATAIAADAGVVQQYENLVLKYENLTQEWSTINMSLSKLLTDSGDLQHRSPNPIPNANTRKPDRPAVDLECSETQWLFFVDEWGMYKRKANLHGPTDITDELRSCCTVELRQALFNSIGSERLSQVTEDNLLAEIKKTAVRGKNMAVHRSEFHSHKQDPNQRLQDFICQLRAKAEHCQFTIQCTNPACGTSVNYATEMICDQMILGCYDKDIQTEVLSKAAILDTFSAKLDLMQSLESGKQAKTELVVHPHPPSTAPPSSVVAAQKTTYQKSKKNASLGVEQSHEKKRCQGCGGSLHGKNGREHYVAKKAQCPARNHTCENCNTIGHFKSVCRSERSNNTQAFMGEPVGYFQSFACESAASQEALKADTGAIPHVEWKGNGFHPATPTTSPRIKVDITVLDDCHRTFGRKMPWSRRRATVGPTEVLAVADTGAQTCCAGPEILDKLNVPRGYLVPTSHLSVGIDQQRLQILGVALVSIKASGTTAYHPLYITQGCRGLYLSRQAQVDLGIINKSYPKINDNCDDNLFNMTTKNAASESGESGLAPCGCPRRQHAPPKPSHIPYAPTPENREKLEKWILERYKSSAFNTCEHQALPRMTGRPLDIHIEEGAKPVAYHTPIPIAHHWKRKVKADLDRDTRIGTIEPVPQGTPTEWCARMVVVEKHDGEPRRTIDLQHLNKVTKREPHHTPAPYNQASVVPPHTKKTVLDAWNGYHGLPLSAMTRELTTFITEFGRYRCLRSPMGFHAAGDGYTRRFDDITVDIPQKTKCVDDTLLWDSNIEEPFWHTLDYLDLCCSNGVIFNPKKFAFAKDEVDFAGFTITKDGIRPMRQLLSAILDFPTPTNISGVRSWFGLINQVSYAVALSEKLEPFRDLLKPSTKWYWDDTLDTLFRETNQQIAKQAEEGVKSFEVNRPTCLSTDWSKTGLGFFLLQKHCKCTIDEAPNCCPEGWKLVMAGSRFTNSAESRYAPVEGEALAVIEALDKSRMFVLGCPDLIVATDHKPLVKILGDRCLEDIRNPRLLNIKEKTLRYRFAIKHVAGGWNRGPDALSRFPTTRTVEVKSCYETDQPDNQDQYTLERATEATVVAAFHGDGVTEGIRAVTWDRVKQAAGVDKVSRALVQTISEGFPDQKTSLPQVLQPYWNMRSQLTSVDGVPVVGVRTVIPVSLREEILDNLHSAHQGVNGMKARARTSVYWPGIRQAIDRRRSQCETCNRISPSQPVAPLVSTPTPDYPFQQCVADFFHMGGHRYLVYADRYTSWFSIIQTSSDSGGRVLITILRDLFSAYGVPEQLATDGGPPFTSHEVTSFLQRWGINTRLSSAYYPQSNGRAELAVKTAKRLLSDNIDHSGKLNTDKLVAALLQYRNTPIQDIGLSPAQLLFGRNLRDSLPLQKQQALIRPEWRLLADDREKALAKRNLRAQERYNKHAKELVELAVGDQVQVQNQSGSHPTRWDKTGTVVESLGRRQYSVKMDGSGRLTLRNRQFLRKIIPIHPAKVNFDVWNTNFHDPYVKPVPHDADYSETPSRDLEIETEVTTQPNTIHDPEPQLETVQTDVQKSPLPLRTDPVVVPDLPTTTPRRGTRRRQRPRDLSPSLRGKFHGVHDR